ncbi:MAG: Re/Si-specific NAD(P)(+) transhydrogenase subunit alpha [Actinomycetota bacterium]|nr:Re/Si-specific NAD(P)(+) transhydrogenase subunit alpha [Actinomycetota bacterium]MDQ2957280.1 Re/Si-specific NAD(P)(+) transhydrogenase subunit alpha [Actinomycetota bacterium]
MSTLRVAALKETAAQERRVALDPDGARRLIATGLDVLIESGAGAGCWFSDESYTEVGAKLGDRASVLAEADLLVAVGPPSDELLAQLRSGQAYLGMLAPLTNPALVRRFAELGVTAISLDGLPRTLTRAQSMDALSSQASVAGYRAVLVAAEHYDRFFPMLMTAAGTSKPATVLVLGAGVAGLQAIGTARRLGAVVSGYDVRPAARDEVKSLGAKFVELKAGIAAAGDGGYARELTDSERQAQQAELAEHIARHDIVITTAQVPGRRPPVLITAEVVARMRPGSVIVDLAASSLGGNVEGSVAGETVLTGNGVSVVGAANLPSRLATSASQAFSRNVSALVNHLTADGALAIDLTDEIAQGVVITHGGKIVHAAAAAAVATSEGAGS